MEVDLLENEGKEETNGALQTDAKPEVPFKKPILLIGKRGSLPRKVPIATATTASSTNASVTSDSSIELKSLETLESKENRSSNAEVNKAQNDHQKLEPKTSKAPTQQETEKSPVRPYVEPDWSGSPETTGKPYAFEVLKNGSIIETINLMSKPYWIFGRMVNSDICMQHPTISRYHAVIQYRDIPSEDDPPGFYVYDLGSTHGTFLNGKKNKLKPGVYAPIRVGHILRLGCSQRSYILTGPDDDQEDESELSVTELKQLRQQKIKDHEEKIKLRELARKEKEKLDEERGVDWGMGDDADAEEDVGENPYAASSNNEDLYLDDPKKALRGWFEREGEELEYDCSEQGMGQFFCKVALPFDDTNGKPIVAEVLHRGKKKEAVVQCALEACRILDRFGVLRQANHESRKRKNKNWEENDYYDSDEDTFLDRTGTIEKKREKRMKGNEATKAETYESLVAKESEISTTIVEIEKKLNQAQAKLNASNSSTNNDEDSLDSYMKGLKDDKPDKQTVSKLRLELINLRKSHANVVRLANIAKPANLPALVSASTSASTLSNQPKKHNFPIFGKRKPFPVMGPSKPSHSVGAPQVPGTSAATVEEESDEETEQADDNQEVSPCSSQQSTELARSVENKIPEDMPKPSTSATTNICQTVSDNEVASNGNLSSDIPMAGESSNISAGSQNESESNESPEEIMSSDLSEEPVAAEPSEIVNLLRPIKTFHETKTFQRFEEIMKTGLPALADKRKNKLVKILKSLQRLAANEDRMQSDWKILAAKKRKVLKWIADLQESEFEPNERLEHMVSTELKRILGELNIMTEDKFKVIGKVKEMGYALKQMSMDIDEEIQRLKTDMTTECTCAHDKEKKVKATDTVDYSNPIPGPSKEPLGTTVDSSTDETASKRIKNQIGDNSNENSNNLPGSSKELLSNTEDSFENDKKKERKEVESPEKSGASKDLTTNAEDSSEEVDDKKKKKRNQKRNEQRQHKAEQEKLQGYKEDASKENYNMWVPPNDQSGDGRTSLNDKLGY